MKGKSMKNGNTRPAKGDFSDAWPGLVMLVVACAAIPIAITGLATRGGVPWSVMVLLIVVCALAFMASVRNRRRSRHRREHDAQGSEREEQLQQEIADLRQRVETLERIVTDRRYTLEREFDALQDS